MIDPIYLSGPARAHRPNIMARHHVVVSGHYYASLAGLQILEAGGNAIDAGVATGLAIDVLESEFVGFGGVAPAMIHLAERDERHVISGVGVWPKAASIEHFHRYHGGRIPDGLLHCVVPAAPSIWITALARFGTMSFGEVAAAAIRFARDGFPTYPFLAEQLAARAKDFCQWPTTAAIFLPNGKPPAPGDLFVQSDLGRTLQYMADQERAHANGDRLAGLQAARDAFYQRRHRRCDPAPPARRTAAGSKRTILPASAARSNRLPRSALASSMCMAADHGRKDRWCWKH